jgi:RND family efflux transporter MFP subunit
LNDLSSDLASLKIDRSPRASSSSSWLKWLTWLAVLAGIAGGVRWAYPLVEAQLFKTEVKTGTIVDVSPSLALTSLTATGYVIAERRSKVGSNVPGRIAKLHVKEGSQVKAGDVLVELDAADQRGNVAAAQARTQAAEASINAQRASLAEIEVQLARQKALASQNAAARSVVEDLDARAATLRAQVASAVAEAKASQAQVQLARITLDRMTIAAPLDGTVLDKPLDVGETVDVLTPMLELADLNSLVVEIDVPETRLALVKVGGPAEISLDAFPGNRLTGRVREIGKRVNRSKATVPVKVEFVGDREGVLPEMSARVSFLTEALDAKMLAAPSKVVVPAGAVTKRGGGDVVFVVDGGKARMENVSLGPTTSDGIELLSGPRVGSRVVLAPPATLADGQTVKERSE